MTHVRIQGFTAGDTQHHRAQNDEGGAGLVDDESQRIVRTDRPQDGGLRDDVIQAQRGDDRKPDQGDRAEELADAAGASLLHHEEAQQDDEREWHHEFDEGGRDHLQTFHGREHRDGRRDHPVTIKQTRAGNAHDQQHLA